MLWFNRQRTSENVLQTYEKRLIACENAINRLNSELLSVAMDNSTLRDKVLRKIQTRKSKEQEETEENQPEGVVIPV